MRQFDKDLKEKDVRIAEVQQGAKEADARIAEANARAKGAEAQVATAMAASHDAVSKGAAADARSMEASAKAEGFRADIAKSNERAAEANRIAEQERLARLQLEARLADRVIAPDQRRRLTSAMMPLKGKTIDIVIFGDTPEIAAFSSVLLECIALAGLPMNISHPLGGGPVVRGVLLGAKYGETDAEQVANLVVGILRESIGSGVSLWKFDELISTAGAASVSQTTGAAPRDAGPLRLFIGGK